MTDDLISTKFHSPISMGRLTVRPRLYSRLEESILAGCRLVLVTAPAGFGKSTLVSAWLQEQQVPFAWLSLDVSDNEPGLFLTYLVGALQKIDPNLGMSQTHRIKTAQSADSEAVYVDVMKNLINEIGERSDTFILVLDDCHVLKDPLLFRHLNFLIDHQPPQLHLMLLSREDLPLPVSRMRVRRQVVEIRQSDLLFTTEETEDFLREGMGIPDLTKEDILALEQRTEGWIAGLQLAGLSIRSDPDPSHFIKSFTGSNRYILDYFMEEVFTRQSKEIQEFLLASSILDRFCAPLCDALIQVMDGSQFEPQGGSQAMLQLLEHANLFLIPLDYQRKWYRYHHLFTDLLRHALVQSYPKEIAKLHLCASQWLEANGFILEAVRHAFLTQDWSYTAELVERHAWNMMLHSQVGTVSEWCHNFPEDIISRHPVLCIFHGWALTIGFKKSDFPAAIVRIEQAEKTLSYIDPHAQISLVVGARPVNRLAWVTGQLTLLRSFILMETPRKDANPQALVDLGQLSYEQLPKEDITGLSVSLLDICYASQGRSDVDDAEKKFAHVVGVALSGGNYFGAVVAEYHRAHGMFSQGRLQDTIAFCIEKRQIYSGYFDQPVQDLPAIALLDQAQGCALLEMNEFEQAEQLLCSGLEVGQWMPREELPGYLALARLYAMKADFTGLEESLRRLELRWPDIAYCTQAMRILYELISHPQDVEVRRAALEWAGTHSPELGPGILVPGIGPAWHDEADYAVYTAWIRVMIILGEAGKTLQIIQPILDVALEHGLFHRVIDLCLLQAQAYYLQGQKDQAWQPLRMALSRAEKSWLLAPG